MDGKDSVTSGFVENVSISDGMTLKHFSKGKLKTHKIISDKKETNLLTKEVILKKEVSHGL